MRLRYPFSYYSAETFLCLEKYRNIFHLIRSLNYMKTSTRFKDRLLCTYTVYKYIYIYIYIYTFKVCGYIILWHNFDSTNLKIEEAGWLQFNGMQSKWNLHLAAEHFFQKVMATGFRCPFFFSFVPPVPASALL